MKKIDDKMLNKRREEEGVTNENDGGTDAVTCNCCNLPVIINTYHHMTEAGEKKEDFEQGHRYHHKNHKYKEKFDSPKLLIIIGLALTYTHSLA